MEVDGLKITQFKDYREYLRQVFAAKQKLNPKLSFRRFAAVVGFKSPNYFQMILDGRRSLLPTTAALVAQKLKFSFDEELYFVALVKLAAAGSDAERIEAERSRLMALKQIVSKDISAEQSQIFAKWYYLVVRELFLLPEAQSDPEWIVARLAGCITTSEAKEAVHLLLESGFLVKKGNRLLPADPVLDTDDSQVRAEVLRRLHQETLRVWSHHLDRLSPEHQELGILNLSISSARIPELKARIRRFQDELLGWLEDGADADMVVQVGTYLIPYSQDHGSD